MQLSLQTDYALRLLMLLAAEPERLHTIEEVARRYRISRNHLMKIVAQLTEQGLVSSLRGRGGGLRLAAAPETLTVGQVVRLMEGRLEPVTCEDPNGGAACVVVGACRLQGVFAEAMQAFLAVLDRWTLAAVAAEPRAAQRLLARLVESPVQFESSR